MEIDLSDFAPLRRGPACTVGMALKLLKGEQLEKTQHAMTLAHIQNVMIARRLSEWTDVTVKDAAVSRHRKKECGCD